jgi:two-component system, NarL family, response regulator LiaR
MPAEPRLTVVPPSDPSGVEHSLRVLIADDDPDLRLLLRHLVERDGMEVVGVAEDGHEAIERAARSEPDVVILDVDMPRLDGLRAIEGILAACPGTRIVMFSAYCDRYEEAMRAGAHGWVTKGADQRTLLRTIQHALGGSWEDHAPPSR